MDLKKLQKILKHLIKSFEYEDAIFLAERCIAEGDTSPRTLYHLALSYEHIGKSEKALNILQNIPTKTQELNFLYCRLLFKNKRYSQIQTFVASRMESDATSRTNLAIKTLFGKYSGPALKILAQVHRYTGDMDKYVSLLHACLEHEPFLWSSVEQLCHMRSPPDFSTVIRWPSTVNHWKTSVSDSSSQKTDSSETYGLLCTPESPRSPSRVLRSTPVVSTRRKISAIDSPKPKISKLHSPAAEREPPSDLDSDSFECRVVKAYRAVGTFLAGCENLATDIRVQVSALPVAHRHSNYVTACLGAAMFHQTHNEAEIYFRKVFAEDPYWTKHLDVYSSQLWQMNDQTKLQHLVSKLTSVSPLASETWIAAGNLESLRKQPSKAISYFVRAHMVDPLNPYTFTLHASEQLESNCNAVAESLLLRVVHIDPYHYQGWYLLGRIKADNHNYTEAVKMLNRALEANPLNVHLHSFIIHCLRRDNKLTEALQAVELALTLLPSNHWFLLNKGMVLFKLKRFQDSLTVVQQLLNVCRFDNAVLLLATEVYGALKMEKEAIECASLVISHNRANPVADHRARELLKTFGLSRTVDLPDNQQLSSSTMHEVNTMIMD